MLVDIAMPGSDGYGLIRAIRGMSSCVRDDSCRRADSVCARGRRRKSLESDSRCT
jgi:CheY-like chemotaxis protein